MRAYVFEQQYDRRAALIAEMRTSGFEPQIIEPEFFQSDLSVLLQPGHETRAVMLGECKEVRSSLSLTLSLTLSRACPEAQS